MRHGYQLWLAGPGIGQQYAAIASRNLCFVFVRQSCQPWCLYGCDPSSKNKNNDSNSSDINSNNSDSNNSSNRNSNTNGSVTSNSNNDNNINYRRTEDGLVQVLQGFGV